MITPLKLIVAATLGALLWTGCASFVTIQKDISYDPKTGNKVRSISTEAKAGTFWEAKSELSKFKASQTDKTQSAAVGSLGQEANSSNVVSLAESVVRGAVKGAVEGATGVKP